MDRVQTAQVSPSAASGQDSASGSNLRKIAVGDLGEFWYGDYKEPFVQLEGAVPGYPQGVVLKDDAGRLLCAYCGKTFHNLGAHANATHGLPAPEYKREVGLLQKSALVSETGRQRSIRVALRNRSDGKFIDPPRDRKRRHLRGTDHPAYTPEALNKTGTCYAQVTAVARQIVTQQGKVTWAALQRHGIDRPTIRRYFGGIEGLRRFAQVERPRQARRWTDAQLIDALRNTARDLGRTPTESDLSRYGLPVQRTYVRRFGSLGAAVTLAGLPPNGHAQFSDDETVMALRLYSLHGNIHLVADRMGRSASTVSRYLRAYDVPLGPKGTPNARAEARAWAAEVAERIASPVVEAVA